MKRQRRNRSPRRHGLQHIGELLSVLVDEIDQVETNPSKTTEMERMTSHRQTPAVAPAPAGQTTFAFYQTAGV